MRVTTNVEPPRRVLIIGINYLPEPSGIGPYTAGLAEELRAQGDDVTVLTGFPHYPEWRARRGAPLRLIRRESIRGVTVVRVAHFVPTTQSAINRALYEATFGLAGLLASLRLPRPHLVLGVIPSLSGGVLARLTARRLGVPYGLLFQDIVSKAALQSGIAGGAGVARATGAAEAWAARGAQMIGVVAEGYEPYLVSLGVPERTIAHVPNWTRLAVPEMSVPETRATFGWADQEQVVLHAGNMGLKQGLEQVTEAARIAAERGEPIRFVLSGGGNQADAVHEASQGLPNVSVLGVQSDGMHASLLAAADVLLLSERATQIDSSLPSKLTSYFAAGRPIVAAVAVDGGSAHEVERSGAGLVIPAGQPEELLEVLARLRAEPALRARLAAAGHAYAASHTSAAACLARATALIDAIAG